MSKSVKYFLILIIAFGIGWFIYKKIKSSSPTPQYQTSTVQKGTLIVSLTGSGQVSAANSAVVTTQATGVVKRVYLKDGNKVKTSQKILEIDLDPAGRQNVQSAYSSYLSSKNALTSSQNSLRSAEASLAVVYDQVKGHDTDETLTQKETRTKAEVAKDNAYLSVVNAQAAISSNWLKYQQASSVVYAPISGTITGLSLQFGSVISSVETKIANITTSAPPLVSLNFTQVDIAKIKVGQKATLTFDAFPDLTYTGKVASVDTVGAASSGVVQYPVTISLDTFPDNPLPNMSVSANIITASKADVLLAPSGCLQIQDGVTTARVLKNNQLTSVPVEIGLASDTQTEIVSGLSEGDAVVTSVSSAATRSGTQTQSIFGGFGPGRQVQFRSR